MQDQKIVTYHLNEIDEAILLASALAGRIQQDHLVAAVQLIDVSSLDYAALLKISLEKRMIFPTLAQAIRSAATDNLEDILKKSGFNKKDLTRRIELLIQLEILERDYIYLRLSTEGIRLAKSIQEGKVPLVRSPKREQRAIFFAGAFGRSDVDRLYTREVVPTCEELGYSPLRVDLREENQPINGTILSGIQQAACVLADLTYARPSVYFEVGMAHGLGVPVVLTCRSDHYLAAHDLERVHFDLAAFKISFWTVAPDDRFTWPKSMHPSERLGQILGRVSPTRGDK